MRNEYDMDSILFFLSPKFRTCSVSVEWQDLKPTPAGGALALRTSEAEPSNPHSPLPQLPRRPRALQAPGLHFPEYVAATSLPGRPFAQDKGSRLATQPEIPGGAPGGWGREAGKA